jgi:hypothetical protein
LASRNLLKSPSRSFSVMPETVRSPRLCHEVFPYNAPVGTSLAISRLACSKSACLSS